MEEESSEEEELIPSRFTDTVSYTSYTELAPDSEEMFKSTVSYDEAVLVDSANGTLTDISMSDTSQTELEQRHLKLEHDTETSEAILFRPAVDYQSVSDISIESVQTKSSRETSLTSVESEAGSLRVHSAEEVESPINSDSTSSGEEWVFESTDSDSQAPTNVMSHVEQLLTDEETPRTDLQLKLLKVVLNRQSTIEEVSEYSDVTDEEHDTQGHSLSEGQGYTLERVKEEGREESDEDTETESSSSYIRRVWKPRAVENLAELSSDAEVFETSCRRSDSDSQDYSSEYFLETLASEPEGHTRPGYPPPQTPEHAGESARPESSMTSCDETLEEMVVELHDRSTPPGTIFEISEHVKSPEGHLDVLAASGGDHERHYRANRLMDRLESEAEFVHANKAVEVHESRPIPKQEQLDVNQPGNVQIYKMSGNLAVQHLDQWSSVLKVTEEDDDFKLPLTSSPKEHSQKVRLEIMLDSIDQPPKEHFQLTELDRNDLSILEAVVFEILELEVVCEVTLELINPPQTIIDLYIEQMRLLMTSAFQGPHFVGYDSPGQWLNPYTNDKQEVSVDKVQGSQPSENEHSGNTKGMVKTQVSELKVSQTPRTREFKSEKNVVMARKNMVGRQSEVNPQRRSQCEKCGEVVGSIEYLALYCVKEEGNLVSVELCPHYPNFSQRSSFNEAVTMANNMELDSTKHQTYEVIVPTGPDAGKAQGRVGSTARVGSTTENQKLDHPAMGIPLVSATQKRQAGFPTESIRTVSGEYINVVHIGEISEKCPRALRFALESLDSLNLKIGAPELPVSDAVAISKAVPERNVAMIPGGGLTEGECWDIVEAESPKEEWYWKIIEGKPVKVKVRGSHGNKGTNVLRDGKAVDSVEGPPSISVLKSQETGSPPEGFESEVRDTTAITAESKLPRDMHPKKTPQVQNKMPGAIVNVPGASHHLDVSFLKDNSETLERAISRDEVTTGKASLHAATSDSKTDGKENIQAGEHKEIKDVPQGTMFPQDILPETKVHDLQEFVQTSLQTEHVHVTYSEVREVVPAEDEPIHAETRPVDTEAGHLLKEDDLNGRYSDPGTCTIHKEDTISHVATIEASSEVKHIASQPPNINRQSRAGKANTIKQRAMQYISAQKKPSPKVDRTSTGLNLGQPRWRHRFITKNHDPKPTEQVPEQRVQRRDTPNTLGSGRYVRYQGALESPQEQSAISPGPSFYGRSNVRGSTDISEPEKVEESSSWTKPAAPSHEEEPVGIPTELLPERPSKDVHAVNVGDSLQHTTETIADLSIQPPCVYPLSPKVVESEGGTVKAHLPLTPERSIETPWLELLHLTRVKPEGSGEKRESGSILFTEQRAQYATEVATKQVVEKERPIVHSQFDKTETKQVVKNEKPILHSQLVKPETKQVVEKERPIVHSQFNKTETKALVRAIEGRLVSGTSQFVKKDKDRVVH